MTLTLLLATILQILAALFMAFIWAAFLRKLDIFKPEKWGKILVAFLFGCTTVIPVLLLQHFLPGMYKLRFSHNSMVQTFAFFTINVGLIEELAKFSGFLLVFFIFRKWFDEDINFVVYGSLTALGFATVENCIYFAEHGIYLVYIRGLMSTFSHMVGTTIITSLLCVGIRKNSFFPILLPLMGLMIVACLHGLFDAFLSLGAGIFGLLTAGLVFMIEIELWAQYSNNFLNRSAFYKNNIAIDRTTLQKFLISAFVLASLIQFAGLVVQEGFASGFQSHIFMLILELILTFIMVARLTRFTVKPGHWEKVYPRLPFARKGTFLSNSPNTMAPFAGNSFSYIIRGDEFNEYPFTSRINKLTSLVPFKTAKHSDNQIYQCWIIDKVFLGKKKELYYLCEMAGHTFNIENAHPKYFLIKPKLEGTKYMQNWPIIGIITISAYVDIRNIPLSEARFLRWSVFKDDEKESLTQTWKEMIF
jgi:RsiW-degrading membrane proteinase PrsW (M82 family)